MKWEEISPSLGLTQQQEESIRRTYRDYEDQKRESLRMWKRNKGDEATFGAFITAAEGIFDMELADSVRGFMKTIPGMHASINRCAQLYSKVINLKWMARTETRLGHRHAIYFCWYIDVYSMSVSQSYLCALHFLLVSCHFFIVIRTGTI